MTWKKREWRYKWAIAHPDKVRQANQTYRQLNRRKTNAQAAARMRRYRRGLRYQGTSEILT
jgi:hypothetical protein